MSWFGNEKNTLYRKCISEYLTLYYNNFNIHDRYVCFKIFLKYVIDFFENNKNKYEIINGIKISTYNNTLNHFYCENFDVIINYLIEPNYFNIKDKKKYIDNENNKIIPRIPQISKNHNVIIFLNVKDLETDKIKEFMINPCNLYFGIITNRLKIINILLKNSKNMIITPVNISLIDEKLILPFTMDYDLDELNNEQYNFKINIKKYKNFKYKINLYLNYKDKIYNIAELRKNLSIKKNESEHVPIFKNNTSELEFVKDKKNNTYNIDLKLYYVILKALQHIYKNKKIVKKINYEIKNDMINGCKQLYTEEELKEKSSIQLIAISQQLLNPPKNFYYSVDKNILNNLKEYCSYEKEEM